MPALQREYDYYEYSKLYQGTAKKAVPNSAVHKNRESANYKSSLNVKTTTTRDVTRKATRIATRDDEFIAKKKKNVQTKNVKSTKKNSIDAVTFNNKKNVKKPPEMILTKPKSNVQTKSFEKQKAKVKEVLRNTVLGTMIFGLLFLICYRYTMINEAFNNLNDLKADVRNKQTINSQLESNIKQNTDLAYIENYAKYQLGMQKPKESQIQKVVVGKQDKILVPIEIKEEEEINVFDNFFNSIINKFN